MNVYSFNVFSTEYFHVNNSLKKSTIDSLGITLNLFNLRSETPGFRNDTYVFSPAANQEFCRSCFRVDSSSDHGLRAGGRSLLNDSRFIFFAQNKRLKRVFYI